MILSLSKGDPIAIIRGGKYNGKILHIYDHEKEEAKLKKKKKYDSDSDDISESDEEYEINIDDPYDYINEDFIRNKHKKLSVVEMNILKNALRKQREPAEPHLEKIYKSTHNDLLEKAKKEFNIHDGQMMIIPDKTTTQRIYICGPTGSGKSVLTSKYATEFKKMFPKSKLFVFSDVEEDEVIDNLKPIRIMLNEEIVENPIKPDEVKDSLCIFDDIDSIQNKKVSGSVCAFRDALLKRGRHENVNVVITGHQITNYKDTRTILNECNYVCFFPKSGSTHGIKYMLKTYMGMNNNQINRIFDLPSRWVCVHKNFPLFVLYEKGCYLV